jgi:DNA primase
MDILEVIDKLAEFELIRKHKRVGNYMQIYCPFHNDGKERKPSCGILLVDEFRGGKKYPQGFTHCFTCGYAHTIDQTITDLLKQQNIQKSGVDWLVENIPGFELEDTESDFLIPNELMGALLSKYAVDYISTLTSKKQEYVSEEELAKYRFTVPYMYERKLTDELIEKFDVGFDANWIPPGRKKPVPCITFPVRDINGNTLFFCRRAISTKLFNYPQGVTKPVYGLYELPNGCKSVVVCESCFNAITSTRYGRPAVALLGTGNSYQIQQLKELGVREFILAFDPDEAGQRATAKLKKALRSVAIVWSFDGIPPGKDINDLTQEEFDALELV